MTSIPPMSVSGAVAGGVTTKRVTGNGADSAASGGLGRQKYALATITVPSTAATGSARRQSVSVRAAGALAARLSNVPSSASCTSRMSAMRFLASFFRHSSIVVRTFGATLFGSALKSGSRSSTRASVEDTSSPRNAG